MLIFWLIFGKNKERTPVRNVKLLLAITSLLLMISTLQATPVVVHIDTRVLKPTHMIIPNAATFNGSELSPLVFQPTLYSGTNFSFSQSPTDDGRAIFTIIAPANSLLNAQILPAASGFLLKGHDIPGTDYPQITNTQFAAPVDSSGNFTMSNTGNMTLSLGGSIFGSAETTAGFYQSESNLMLKITNRTTLASIQIPFQINFNYLTAGKIQAVRSLVFPVVILTPGVIFSQNVNAGDPESAEVDYAPLSGTLNMVTTNVCLTKNGAATPPTSCSCTDSSSPVVTVMLSDSNTSKSCSPSAGACKVFIGGSACYPAGLLSGTYKGTGIIRMTYS